MFLELAAILLAAYIVQKPEFLRRLSIPFMGLLLAMALLPVLQLVPLPFAMWSGLPGHDQYAQALIVAGAETTGSRAFSVVPSLTEYSGLALLPPLAVFLFTIGLPKERLRVLVPVFLGLAAFQAILGLVQYGDGPDSPFRLGNALSGASAAGTYVNRDHLAGLLEMALPLGLAMLTATLGHSGAARRHARSLAHKVALLVLTYFNRAAIYGFVSIALLLGLIFTQSRTGVVLGMVGIFLSALAFSIRLGGRNVYGMLGTFTAFVVALALEIGLVPVLDRFAQSDPLKDSRWSIYASVSQAIGEFFPLGSGIGTFNQAYLRFHAPDLPGMFINRAHNDYLEWIMEGGIIAAVLIAGFLLLYLKRWFRIWKRDEWQTFNFVQVGAGIGLFTMMLHTLVDFNLHIPANQIYFAFLAALFFYPSQDEKAGPEVPVQDIDTAPADVYVPPAKKILQVQPGPNPFAE